MFDRTQYMRDYRLKKKAEKAATQKPKIIKTAAERSKEYRERLKLKRLSAEIGNEQHNSTAKTAAERSREYRERQKLKIQSAIENGQPSISTTKSQAERCREYRKRLKLKKQSVEINNEQPSTSKTAAERSKEYRDRQKLKRLSEGFEIGRPNIFIMKSQAERCREYRKRQKLKRQLGEIVRPSTSKTASERGKEYRERQKLKRQFEIVNDYSLANVEFNTDDVGYGVENRRDEKLVNMFPTPRLTGFKVEVDPLCTTSDEDDIDHHHLDSLSTSVNSSACSELSLDNCYDELLKEETFLGLSSDACSVLVKKEECLDISSDVCSVLVKEEERIGLISSQNCDVSVKQEVCSMESSNSHSNCRSVVSSNDYSFAVKEETSSGLSLANCDVLVKQERVNDQDDFEKSYERLRGEPAGEQCPLKKIARDFCNGQNLLPTLTPPSSPRSVSDHSNDSSSEGEFDTTTTMDTEGQSMIRTLLTDVKHSKLKKYRCKVMGCKRVFTKSWYLKIHERRHTGDKPHKCSWNECDWSFARFDELARHYSSKHTGAKPLKCHYCNRSFSRFDHLTIHMKRHV